MFGVREESIWQSLHTVHFLTLSYLPFHFLNKPRIPATIHWLNGRGGGNEAKHRSEPKLWLDLDVFPSDFVVTVGSDSRCVRSLSR